MRSATPLLLALSVSFGAPHTAAQDLIEVARSAGGFETLLTAVEAAGLTNTLRGDGPFTVFAPTNDAFEALPDGALAALLRPGNRSDLAALLQHHVAAGSASGAAALQAGAVETLDGARQVVRLSEGALRVGDARVVTNDLEASNGIIHVIDTVLLPAEPVTPIAPSAARGAADALSLAIERGVPLFNAGQEDACAAIYEVAATAVLGTARDTLREGGRTALETGLERAAGLATGRAKAWALRRGIDGALRDLLDTIDMETEPTMTTSTTSEASNFRTVFGFDEPADASAWFTLNDDVMGGISQSAIVRTPNGTGIFRGRLSLENNGGFATIRSRATDLGLEGSDGVVLRVKGDGRRYSFGALASDRRFEINTWRTKFDTTAGEWTEVRIPFADLVRTVMGRSFPRSAPLPPERITSFSFSISDKNETPFALEIDSIRTYRGDDVVGTTD